MVMMVVVFDVVVVMNVVVEVVVVVGVVTFTHVKVVLWRNGSVGQADGGLT